jgi:Ca2+-binding RTX toxin-like protein
LASASSFESGTDFITINAGGLGLSATIIGSGSDDVITGSGVADVITSGDGADTITGGLGIDTITTGAGIDKVSYAGVALAANANNITDFTVGASGDILQFSDTLLAALAGAFTAGTAVATTTVALVGGGSDVVNEIIVDTIANLGALGVTIGNVSANTNNVYQLAIASDTGAIFYDADGNWVSGSVQIGTIGVQTTALVSANFEIIA